MAQQVRIYQPAKTAMQSGKANTSKWVLEFEPARKFVEPLMGWIGSRSTTNQVKLRFSTKAEAIKYAQRKGLEYRVEDPHARTIKPKNYADNFAFNRVRS